MPEFTSALPGARAAGFATVTEAGLRGMITLRADLASAAVQTVLQNEIGLPVPAQRAIVTKGDRSVAWMSPDELLIMAPYEAVLDLMACLQAALGDVHSLVVNVSDARALFRVEGARAREVLAKLAPVDLSSAVFKQGEIRRTRLAQVAAAFWMNGPESFEIVCFRSVAQYVFDLLEGASAPGGEVGVL